MSQEVLVVVCIVGILLLIALIKELFSLVARKIIQGVGAIIKGIFSLGAWIVTTLFRILISPFSLLWGFITDR